MLERYINIFEYRDKQFSAKRQVLKFYIIYIRSFSKQKSLFIDKVKEQES